MKILDEQLKKIVEGIVRRSLQYEKNLSLEEPESPDEKKKKETSDKLDKVSDILEKSGYQIEEKTDNIIIIKAENRDEALKHMIDKLKIGRASCRELLLDGNMTNLVVLLRWEECFGLQVNLD